MVESLIRIFAILLAVGCLLAQDSIKPLVGAASDGDKEALERLKIRGDKGESDAQYWLGYLYFEGAGFPKGIVQGIAWFRMAAEQGHSEAQLYLASIYFDGSSVPRDLIQAVTWYRKGAEQGNARAQVHLGVMYA